MNRAGRSLRHFDEVKLWHFGNFSDRDGRALLEWPSRIPQINSIFFALGADEFLAMLEGKIRLTPFFKVQYGKILV